MSGDYSRLTDRTRKRYSALLMQQGRVHLDSDWNELVTQVTRRARLQSLDTFGPAAVPVTTPDGFKLTLSMGDVLIGAGRAYVGGMLAEVFPGEKVDTFPVSYLHQPFLPPPLSFGASGLFYLDVWQREVTWLEDPDLLEVALGDIDTTTRLQTVWQVRFTEAGNCDSDLDALNPPSAGRLSTQAVEPPSPDDPCLLPESGGFRGVENRLYRVEIHDGGLSAAATFKWSRENASVATVVQKIDTVAGKDTLTVERTGRDTVLRFQKDDWVEIQDDVRELGGLAGEMAQVTAVNETDRTLSLDRSLTGFDVTDPARHTRVRRWDQRTGVSGVTGVIPVTSALGVWFDLEDGVQVQLTLDTTAVKQEFHVADTWSFAARTADASVEVLTVEPPRAIEHRYAPLATLAGGALTDCRTPWPPATGCECICVTAEAHAAGAPTLQQAIDKVIAAGGGGVCLGPGRFDLTTPLVIDHAVSLTLSGVGSGSSIEYGGIGATIAVNSSRDVTIERVRVVNTADKAIDMKLGMGFNAISISDSVDVRVQRCTMLVRGLGNLARWDGAAVLLSGVVVDCAICDNMVGAWAGVASGADDFDVERPSTSLVLSRARIERNLLKGDRDGVRLDGFTLYHGDLAICDNTIVEPSHAAVTLLGSQVASKTSLPVGVYRVTGNSILVAKGGRGIVASLADVTIRDNEVIGSRAFDKPGTAPAIVLARTPLSRRDGRMEVAENRVFGAGGNGIEIDTELANLTVRENSLLLAGGGIVMTEEARAQLVLIESNRIEAIIGPADGEALGIRVDTAARAEVTGNQVFAVAGATGRQAFGIACVNARMPFVHGNFVEAVVVKGPLGPPLPISASIAVLPVFLDVDVDANSLFQVGNTQNGRWRGIFIEGAIDNFESVLGIDHQQITAGDKSVTNLVVFANGDYAIALAPERVSVCDNVATTAANTTALIDVNVQTDITCTGNRCTLGTGITPTWVIQLVGATAIASNNRVDCGNGSHGDLQIIVGSRGQVAMATVLGNIVHRAIELNGQPLGPPWLPLNILNA